jgi:hypothetical protein
MNFQELMQRMVDLDQPMTEEPNEGNAFSGALDAAKDAGQSEFEVDGNTYKVKEDDFGECGMPGMSNMPGGMMGMRNEPPKQGDSVSMNVSMNGSGAGGIRDLMGILRNIDDAGGAGDEMPMGNMGHDHNDDNMEMPIIMKALGGDDKPDMGADNQDEPDREMDEFANEPDEMYGSVADVTGTGNDIHSKGAEAPKVNGGGNPMKIKAGETFKLPSGDLKIKLEGLYNDIKLRK